MLESAFLFIGFQNLYKTDSKGLINESDTNKCEILAIKKSNGGTYCISHYPMCAKIMGAADCVDDGTPGYGSELFQTNAAGTIAYIVSDKEKFVRIDLSGSNPNNYTQKVLDTSEQFKRNFVVNEIGEAYFRYNIYLLNGNTFKVQTPNQTPFSCVITGPTGTSEQNDFFYTYDTTGQIVPEGKLSQGGSINAIRKFKRLSAVDFQDTAIYSDTVAFPRYLGWDRCHGRNTIKTSNNIYTFAGMAFLSANPPWTNSIKHLTASQHPTDIEFAAFGNLNQIFLTDGGFILWGKSANNFDGIQKYTEAGGIKSTILPANNDYSISNMTVSLAGKITFTGKRNSGNVKVIGVIDPATNFISINKTNVAVDISSIEAVSKVDK